MKKNKVVSITNLRQEFPFITMVVAIIFKKVFDPVAWSLDAWMMYLIYASAILDFIIWASQIFRTEEVDIFEDDDETGEYVETTETTTTTTSKRVTTQD